MLQQVIYEVECLDEPVRGQLIQAVDS